VAARGLDLPDVSLVIHADPPRDAMTLQHRSGRTGRAGRKGTAVLIVPYQRRKRVESMLRGAKIEADWIKVPTAADIRAKDHDRLLETLLAPVEVEDEDRALGAKLLETMSPEDIAAALVRVHRSKMPQAEDMLDDGSRERPRDDHRAGFDDSVWFKLNVGRRNNADPKWILPLLCRRGGVTKNDIGAIRIAANETHVGIAAAAVAATTPDPAPVAPPVEPPAAPPAAASWTLIWPGGEVPIGGNAVVIGRSKDCDVPLADGNVSRRHAELGRSEEGFVLRDLDSTNGTMVNGRRIRSATIGAGDEITIGMSTLRIEQRHG
jgi:hypothetical protein